MLNRLLMGVLMMAAESEPTFSTSGTDAQTRVSDHLELAFQPANPGDPVAWERVPLVTELQGFQPSRNTVRKDAFEEADGTAPSLVVIIKQGGSIQFTTASKGALADRILKATTTGEEVLFKATYSSVNKAVWGSCKLGDRGIQGSRNDIPDWGFTIEAQTAKYVNATTKELIGHA